MQIADCYPTGDKREKGDKLKSSVNPASTMLLNKQVLGFLFVSFMLMTYESNFHIYVYEVEM